MAGAEEKIISWLGGRTCTPKELARIYKDNKDISSATYYRALNRLIKDRQIDEINLKNGRPTGYRRVDAAVVDSNKLDLPIQEMLRNGEPEMLLLGLKYLTSVVSQGRTAWYFSEKTKIRDEDTIEHFFNLLDSSSPEIREMMMVILTNIYNWEIRQNSRWKKDFEDRIWDKIYLIAQKDEHIPTRNKALKLIGNIAPEKGNELSIFLICDPSIDKEKYLELRDQIEWTLIRTDWAQNHKVEIKRKLFELYNSEFINIYDRISIKNNETIKERLHNIMKVDHTL